MQKKLNNKGFSMIEILAVVVILAVVSTIGIVSVTRLLDNSKKHYYESQQEQLVLAARAYAGDHKEILPKELGGKQPIKLSTLYEKNYLKDTIVDKDKNPCDSDKSYVNVIKQSQAEYEYKGYLNCKACADETGYCYEETGESFTPPKVDITLPPPSGVQANKLYEESTTIDLKMYANGDNAKISNYSYKIYVDDVLKYNSGPKKNGKKDYIEVHEPLYKYLPGVVKVVANITNTDGDTKTYSKKENYQDAAHPSCGTVSYDRDNPMHQYSSGNPTCGTTGYLWTNGKRHVWVVCDDKKGIGCSQPEFSKELDSEGINDIVKITDGKNLPHDCAVKKCIDRTTPKIVVKVYKATASGDKGSTIKTFTVPEQKGKTTYTQNDKYDPWINGVDNPKGIIVEVTTQDKSDITNGTSEVKHITWYQNAKNQKENAIGATNSKVHDKDNITTKSYKAEQWIKDDGVRKQVIKVTDYAGNVVTYNLVLKIDFTPPPKPEINMYLVDSTTSKSTSTEYPNNKWKNKYVYVNTTHPKDNPDVSGWRTNQYTTSGKHGTYKDKDGNFINNVTKEGESKVKFRSIDNAGNYSEYTGEKTIKLDRKKPTCDISKEHRYTTTGVTLKTKCEDKANSGVGNKSGVKKCAGTDVNGADSYTDTKTGIKESKEYKVKDVAGNEGSCSVTVKDTQKRTNSWDSCLTGEPSTCKGGTVSKTCNGYKERGANNSGSSCGPKSSCGLGSSCVSCQYDCSYYDSCKTGHPSTCKGGWKGWTDWYDVNSCKASSSKPTKVECRTRYY